MKHELSQQTVQTAGRARRMLREIGLQILILLVTLAAIEVVLRVIDLRVLREGHRAGHALAFRFDGDLGWLPIANSRTVFTGSRSITVEHNSLGLRDIEPETGTRPGMLFLGDSFVWGYDVEAHERFTNLLRRDLSQWRIVNAGIAGYGTDQAYLMLERLWERVKPGVVVLMFCVDNDRADNSSNFRNEGYYKPYFEMTPQGGLVLRGQPVPKSRHAHFIENPVAHNSWIARAIVSGYVPLRHPILTLPDPTEPLVGMMKDYVESRGGKFLMGLQRPEPQLEAFMQGRGIPYTTFERVPYYPADGHHWTPEGHKIIAGRLTTLLEQAGVLSK